MLHVRCNFRVWTLFVVESSRTRTLSMEYSHDADLFEHTYGECPWISVASQLRWSSSNSIAKPFLFSHF
ncbi:hypothetical protein Y032_0475g2127 [Ancylostoma ceylanicum]|uniref:Uncharacterized protein n=1 Tax=Ancylostoma ceylanicum TaxID=53326 RepID=A0A016WWE3_9BILA|nr:hypothetical protein Y032_0475g2127 [Ancylostoma ceylanicum]